jgi:catechol 2,3-dioxygenase-like lactoylglutathione lyase family enzyme
MANLTPQARRQLLGVTPVFVVPDVVKAAHYYRDVLGFSYDRFWGDPPGLVYLRREGVDLMLRRAKSPEQVRPNGAHEVLDAYVWTHDVDLLRAELKVKGARLVSECARTAYGTKELEVEDCNGFRLCFAQDLSQTT